MSPLPSSESYNFWFGMSHKELIKQSITSPSKNQSGLWFAGKPVDDIDIKK